MFSYQKRLLYPVHVEHPDKEFADILMEHLKGEESEYKTFFQLIQQRLQIANLPIRDLIGMIAAEELGHIEIIGAAVRKLGVQEIPWSNVELARHLDKQGKNSIVLVQMLKENEEKEEKTKKLYLKHLQLTSDSYLKRMLRFLIAREEIHQNIFGKMATLVAQNANNEKFSSLIHEYKMSLRIIK